MRTTLAVAADLLREARSRKWFLGLAVAITLVLVTLGFSLKLEVVDGALAASRLFGKMMRGDIRAVDVALRPLLQASAYAIFYVGLVFGIVATADFAPSLLSPGRIEHLLAQPVRRWELLLGTFLGVMALSLMASLYGAVGLTLILGVKANLWSWGLILAALLAAVNFCAVYAAMLTAALFARSAAVSAAVGFAIFISGIFAGNRHALIPMFEPGVGRSVFSAYTLVIPRISALATAAADLAASTPLQLRSLTSLLLGMVVFGMGVLALGVYRFEQKDF
ncbi:MAG: ABC transporter permease [Myxococcota bacterium]|nr:ABC transporter permease [Myxococcota bacterium]